MISDRETENIYLMSRSYANLVYVFINGIIIRPCISLLILFMFSYNEIAIV